MKKFVFLTLVFASVVVSAADNKIGSEQQPAGQDRGGAPLRYNGVIQSKNKESEKLLPFYSVFKSKEKTKMTCMGSVDTDIDVNSKRVGIANKFVFTCESTESFCRVHTDDRKLLNQDPKSIKLLKSIKKVLEGALTCGLDMYTSINRSLALEKATKNKEGMWEAQSGKTNTIYVNSQMTEAQIPEKKLTYQLTILDGYLFVTHAKAQIDKGAMSATTEYMKSGDNYWPSRIKFQFDSLDKDHIHYDIQIEECEAQ